MKITSLSLLNFLILQWFFVRLAKVSDADTEDHIKWALLRWPVPLTGWWSSYKFVFYTPVV